MDGMWRWALPSLLQSEQEVARSGSFEKDTGSKELGGFIDK